MLRRLLLLIALPWIAPCQQTAIKPTTTIRLFDGKTLDNFDPWQQDNHERDPDKVFSVVDQVDGAPAIRISGQHWGGLITKSAYRDYKLVVEFRWGLLTWGQRKDRARDSGILLHCQGRPGSSQKDFNGPWMRSIEFQMIDGGVGDIILVGGYAENGELLRPVLNAKTRKDRDGETVFDPNGSARRVLDWPHQLVGPQRRLGGQARLPRAFRRGTPGRRVEPPGGHRSERQPPILR